MADGGSDANGLFYINLADPNTRLEVHYRSKNVATRLIPPILLGVLFKQHSTTVRKSASANYINRNRSGSEFESPTSDALFIQTNPGTYALLKIPELSVLAKLYYTPGRIKN